MVRPRTIIGGIALGLAFFAALTYGHSAGASSAEASDHILCVPCNTDWYVNPDETALKPKQFPGGMLFDGPSLAHHVLAPVSLAALPTDAAFGGHLFHGAMPLIKFESSIPATPGTYSTINKTGTGKYWSSKIATGAGSQSMPLDTPADLIGKWSGYTADTRVFSFGVGYANDVGNKAAVFWVSLGQHKYSLGCPPASPSASASPSATPSVTPSATPTSTPTPLPTTPGPGPTTGPPSTGTPSPEQTTAGPSPSDIVAGLPGSGGIGTRLPTTGYDTSTAVWFGVALILGGALLAVIAWRWRRVRFTA
jgi:LPXTG-motif cell wall-anchored protein